MPKPVILFILVAICAFIFFGLIDRSLLSPDLKSVYFWVKLAIAFGLFSSSIAISFLLIRDWKLGLLIILIPIFVCLVIIGFDTIGLGVGALTFLIWWSYRVGIQKELKERVKISLKPILQNGISGFVAGVLLIISLMYYFTPAVQERTRIINIPTSFEGFVQDLTTKTLLRNASSEVRVQLETPEFKSQLANQVRQITQGILRQMDSFFSPYKKFFPLILTVGFFLALSAFTFLWNWLVFGFTVLMFKIFRVLGLVKVNLVQKEAEELEF